MAALYSQLQAIPLLSVLSPAQLAAIYAICERCAYSPGETIVEAGAQAEAAYLMIDDQINCLTSVEDGNGAATVTPIPAGSTLLELAMIVEVDVTATCVARGAAKVLKVPREKLKVLLQEDASLTEKISEALTNRLKDMADVMREAALPFAASEKLA